MERLTYDFPMNGQHCWQIKGAGSLECREVCELQETDGCMTCPIAKAFDRLAAIENILSDNYDLDRLRELVEADGDGRIAILSEPMKPMAYKSNDTDVYCPTCGETLSGGWPLVEWEDSRTMYQCPYCGQSIDTQVCEPYESALKTMKEKGE